MWIRSRTRMIAKPGSVGQDAAHPRRDVDARRPAARFAVADGATTSLRSELWAEASARAYCRGGLPDRHLDAIVRRHRRAWVHEARGAAGDWVTRAQLREGAGATLAGLTLRDSEYYEELENGRWSCMIVGDCGIFQIRQGRLIAALPFTRSAEIAPRPQMLMTEPVRNRGLHRVRHRGWWTDGDVFYLMSDALLHWCLQRLEADTRPWDVLDRIIGCDRRFEGWVHRKWASGRLRVDDVVVTRIEIRST